MSEYSQDRLKKRINELEAEVNYMQAIIEACKKTDKDRAATEAAIFVMGLTIGVAAGFYAS